MNPTCNSDGIAVACPALSEDCTVRDADLIDLRVQAPSDVPAVTSSCLRRRRRYRLAFYRGACCVAGGPPGLQQGMASCDASRYSLLRVTIPDVNARAARLAAIEQAMSENTLLSLKALRQIGDQAALSTRVDRESEAPATARMSCTSRETQTDLPASTPCAPSPGNPSELPKETLPQNMRDSPIAETIVESSIVVFTGMLTDKSLNGQLGVVTDTSLMSGRFKVMLLGGSDARVVAVSPLKLVPFMSTISSSSTSSRPTKRQYQTFLVQTLQQRHQCVQKEGLAFARVLAECDWQRHFHDGREESCHSSESNINDESPFSDSCV
eukprot:TRINITY_DN7466_c0_g1_i2.p1 TRINITY_DN7466_c0_g1~~TRINITY_DN7466_c0_g1_i2.p1  ORF type:complete len:346 (-),score=20.67 TRINITY_DN7466_c0_g1_i2:232-1206(-)